MRAGYRGLAVAVLSSSAFTYSSYGQSLAELVPADSVVYVGWRGTADPGPGFAGSKWEAVLKDSQVGRLVDETLPAIGSAVERKYPRSGGLWHAATSVVRQLIRKPSAAFVEFEDGKPRGGILIRAGADTKELTQTLQQILTALPGELAPRLVTPGDSVGLVFGYAADAAVEGGLDQQADFKNGLKQCVADPSAAMYVNVKAGLDVVDQLVTRNAPAENVERYHRFIDASGIAGVNAYTSALGFSGKEWQIDAFIDAPAPRRGLLAGDATTPFDADLLKRVPASANSISVMHLDANGVLKTLRDVTAATDPQAGDLFDKAIGGATMAIGKNVQDDLLASLGTQWAAYTSPDIGGTEATGLIVVNKLANVTKAKQSLASLAIFLSNTSKNLIPNKDITIAGRMTRVGDLNVYYLATPLVSPAWVIKDGYLYLGAFPQTVISAARYGGASIADNAAFTAAAAPVDGKQQLSMSYTDVKSTLSNGYALALMGSRTALGMSDIFLAATPEPVMPPLSALQAQAGPAWSQTWTDAAGIHVRQHSPFPGAETVASLSISNLYLTNVPLMTSILLPSLNRAREAANRIKSSSNLRQIGLACKMYANTQPRTAAYPPDLATVIKTQEITPDVFLNPRLGSSLPAVPSGVNPTEYYSAWVDQHTDYIYVGAGKTDSAPADEVLAYEKPSGLTDGINILFADGHVDWVAFGQVPQVFTAGHAELPHLPEN